MAESLFEVFGTDASREEEGAWTEVGGAARFKLRSTESQTAQRWRAKWLERNRRKLRGIEGIPADMLADFQRDLLVEVLVVDWEGVTDRHKVTVPFSREACRELLRQLPRLAALLMEEASSMALFRSEVMDEMGKASSPVSAPVTSGEAPTT